MPLDPTTAPETGQAGDPSQAGSEFDYQRGYESLRPEYTRATQELSQTREQLTEYEQLFAALQDPTTQAEALAALGYELDAGAPGSSAPGPDEFVDPLEEEVRSLREQVAAIDQFRQEQVSTQQEQDLIAMRDQYIGEAISFIEENKNVKFSPKAEEVLGNLAIAMESADGVPDVQAAYEAIYGESGVLETERTAWIDSKRAAAQPPLGTTLPADKRPASRAERINYVDERMRALEDQR